MNSKSSPIGPGVVLPGGYRIVETIGKGSFSEIYAAIRESDAKIVAIKIQGADFDSSLLRWEGNVMQAMSDTPYVPQFILSGQYEKCDYIIMDIMNGEDMTHIRNRIRQASVTGLVPLPIVVFLCKQMLTCIEALHAHGYVHRDVKPSNFMQKSATETKFCVIDFGIVKQYRDRDGTVRVAREKAEFRGTTLYASPFVHEGHDQCPRDDLCSIFHVFLDMVSGALPWGELARQKDKAAVGGIKSRCWGDVRQWLAWHQDLVSNAEAVVDVDKGKDGNLPSRAVESLARGLEYVRSLGYEDLPDYALLHSVFTACLDDESVLERIGDIEYSCPCFSWKKAGGNSSNKLHSATSPPPISLPSHSRQSTQNHTSPLPTPTTHQNTHTTLQRHAPEDPVLRNLRMRIQSLVPAQETHTTPHTPVVMDDYNAAMRWVNIAKEVLGRARGSGIAGAEMPWDSLDGVLVHYHNFMLMSLGEGEGGERWGEFMRIQEVVGEFYEAYSLHRSKKRRIEA